MLWYEGSITEAIQLSKSRKCIFLVYIFGDDELSKKMDATWNNESVSAACRNCVAVKIQSPSDMCQHFSQIYPVVVVPSTFFIGLNGVPIEVIAGNLSPEEFHEKVKEVLKQPDGEEAGSPLPLAGASGAAASASPAVCQADPSPPASPEGIIRKGPEMMQDEGRRAEAAPEPLVASTSETTMQSTPSTSAADDLSPAAAAAAASASGEGEGGTDSSENQADIDRKIQIERMTQKMDQSRIQRAKEEEENEKERELQRRRVGKDVQKLRRNQEERNFKEIQDDIKKQKEEDRKARQRVKDEIERDKLERKAKYEREKAERDRIAQDMKERKQKEQEMTAAQREAARREISRLQFRLPDGSSVTHQFKSSDPLSTANNYITQHLGCSNVQLYTVFPKRTFTSEDMSSSLMSLELVPSAVLLVLPQKNAIARTADSSTGILNIIFAPLLMLWNFVYGLIFGWPSAGSPGTSGESQKRPREEADEPTPSSSGRPSTAYKRRSPISRQEGNIHKFTNNQDDDDDQSTWNGNSTQQM